MYTLKEISASNFEKFDQIRVSFDESVTYLSGPNGSGKSSLLNILYVTMQGVGDRPLSKDNFPLLADRFMIIGNKGVTATTGIVLHDDQLNCDIVVKRKISKDGTKLAFEAPDGIILDQRWLNSLFSVFLINPKRFLSLSPKEQATALGVDVSDIDVKIKELKEEYTLIGRELKGIGTIVEVPLTEAVNVSALVKEKAERESFNKIQADQQKKIDDTKTTLDVLIQDHQEDIQELTEFQKIMDAMVPALKGMKSPNAITWAKDTYTSLKNKIATVDEHIPIKAEDIHNRQLSFQNLPPAEPLKDITELDKQIANASSINVRASEYSQYLQKKEKKEKLEADQQANKDEQQKWSQKRIEKIQSFNLPFNDIECNENGELTLQGRYIKSPYYSAGELIKIVPMLIIASLKASGKEIKFPYVYLDDFSLLDEDTQNEVVAYLAGNGFQCALEVVSKEVSNKPNHIFLKDNKIVVPPTE